MREGGRNSQSEWVVFCSTFAVTDSCCGGLGGKKFNVHVGTIVVCVCARMYNHSDHLAGLPE